MGKFDLNNAIISFIHESFSHKAHQCKNGQLTNVGTCNYPKMLCPPCAHARRVLLTVKKEDKNVAAIHKEVEKKFSHKTKELIRLTRVKPDGEAIAIPGVNSIGAQTSMMSGMLGKYKQEVTAACGIRNQDSWMELPKKPFIAHQIYQNGETPEEAINFTCHLYLNSVLFSNTKVNASQCPLDGYNMR